MGEWQDIATAPKDDVVLLACADWPHSVYRGKAVPIKCGYWQNGWHIWGASWVPTHWMPLPETPK